MVDDRADGHNDDEGGDHDSVIEQLSIIVTNNFGLFTFNEEVSIIPYYEYLISMRLF